MIKSCWETQSLESKNLRTAAAYSVVRKVLDRMDDKEIVWQQEMNTRVKFSRMERRTES